MTWSNSCDVTLVCTNSLVYELEYADGLVTGEWNGVTGQSNVSGETSGEMTLIDATAASAVRTYRVWVEVR